MCTYLYMYVHMSIVFKKVACTRRATCIFQIKSFVFVSVSVSVSVSVFWSISVSVFLSPPCMHVAQFRNLSRSLSRSLSLSESIPIPHRLPHRRQGSKGTWT